MGQGLSHRVTPLHVRGSLVALRTVTQPLKTFGLASTGPNTINFEQGHCYYQLTDPEWKSLWKEKGEKHLPFGLSSGKALFVIFQQGTGGGPEAPLATKLVNFSTIY